MSSAEYITIRTRAEQRHVNKLNSLAEALSMSPSATLRFLIDHAVVQKPIHIAVPHSIEATKDSTGAKTTKPDAGAVSHSQTIYP